MVGAMAIKRSRQLKPLSSEHHHALLVAFQLKKGLAGHGDSAGAPKDLPGLVALARRFEDSVFLAHTRAEEELLGQHLPAADTRRLQFEHRELVRLLDVGRQGHSADARHALTAFADLLERHVRWEERELFPACETAMGEDALAMVGHELEKRLVLSRNDPKAAARRP
jgi:hemerythrin-like domain-containing protein